MIDSSHIQVGLATISYYALDFSLTRAQEDVPRKEKRIVIIIICISFFIHQNYAGFHRLLQTLVSIDPAPSAR